MQTACVGPVPLQEQAIAEAALFHATKSGADRFAKGQLYKAQQSLEKAKSALKIREHQLAKEEFQRTIEFAEQAENTARVKRIESGEFQP